MTPIDETDVLTIERRGHVLLMGLNRPSKRNAFNIELLMELGRAYEMLERDDHLRCGVPRRWASTSPAASTSPRLALPLRMETSAIPTTLAIPGATTASPGPRP